MITVEEQSKSSGQVSGVLPYAFCLYTKTGEYTTAGE